jgi:hypothetical protein
MKKLLYEFTGVVPAPPATVRERLRASLSTGWAQSQAGVFFLQGGWWYRGEFELTPHAHGTQVTHRVFNVAKVGRWAVAPANRFFIGFEKRTRARFEQMRSTLIDANMES